MAEFDDYCDLDPTKLCDNCCKCLEKKDGDYAVLPAMLPDEDEEMPEDGRWESRLPFDAEDGEEDEDEFEFGMHVEPLDIDPALLAEWEAKLADIGGSGQEIPRFRGVRRRKIR